MSDIDFSSLRTIGLTQAIIGQLALLDHAGDSAVLARITSVQRDWMTIHDGDTETPARVLPQLLHALQAEQQVLTVGDWILCDRHDNGERWISARIPPLNQIARRDNDGRRHSLVSNIDTALLVMGLDHDFNLRRLERYLAVVQTAGVAPLVVLTKADLCADAGLRMAQLRQRLPAAIPALTVNALDHGSVQQLAPWLSAGQTLVLLGSSGAGKSTLTNTLSAASQSTGAVRAHDGRGRHTTTARSLHQCSGGACIIDTPGLRSWQVDADEEQLAASFGDVAALASQCRFRDCSHQAEPGCAVRGAVDADRLQNYRKLLREARRGEQTPLDRIAERARWKVIMREAGLRGKNKRS
jgi:ribosome biogenesis GTPase